MRPRSSCILSRAIALQVFGNAGASGTPAATSAALIAIVGQADIDQHFILRSKAVSGLSKHSFEPLR
jgi:hypothetical protein